MRIINWGEGGLEWEESHDEGVEENGEESENAPIDRMNDRHLRRHSDLDCDFDHRDI